MRAVKRSVPHRLARTEKSAHPWLHEECQQAVARKHATVGTSEFIAERLHFTCVLQSVRALFIRRTRDRACAVSTSSKGWWRFAGQLLMKPQARVSILALKRGDSSWAPGAQAKADLFADAFAKTSALPVEADSKFTPPDLCSGSLPNTAVNVCIDAVAAVLLALDESSGTGPDHFCPACAQAMLRSAEGACGHAAHTHLRSGSLACHLARALGSPNPQKGVPCFTIASPSSPSESVFAH